MIDGVALPTSVRDRVEVVYRAEGTKLWRAIYAQSSSRSIADDTVSETFTQLLRRGDAVREPRAWIWRTAFKIAGGLMVSRTESAVGVAERSTTDPETPFALFAALDVLSRQQRAALILHDYIGHSTAETATILNSSQQSVRVQLSRARRSMRKELER